MSRWKSIFAVFASGSRHGPVDHHHSKDCWSHPWCHLRVRVVSLSPDSWRQQSRNVFGREVEQSPQAGLAACCWTDPPWIHFAKVLLWLVAAFWTGLRRHHCAQMMTPIEWSPPLPLQRLLSTFWAKAEVRRSFGTPPRMSIFFVSMPKNHSLYF